jgi:hypothetical protein
VPKLRLQFNFFFCMKAKFLLSLVAAASLSSSAAWAQMGFGKPKDIAIIKSHPLVVILKDEDPKELKKLAKKPEELADYKAAVTTYNQQLQELAPKLWKFSPTVEFKHESDLEALRKAKNTQYGVLKHADFMLAHRHSTNGPNPGGITNPANLYYSSEHVSALVLQVIGDGDESKVWHVQLAPGPIYTSDIIFSLNSIQTYVQSRAAGRKGSEMREEVAQNSKKLPGKTLLIDEEDLKRGLTAADIKVAYPFPYQVVPRATIETAAASYDTRYAYIRLMPLVEGMMVQVAVDAATSDLMGYSLPSRVPMVGGLIASGASVTKSNLKDFAKAAGK